MSTPAKVHSLESIEAVRRAVALFDEQVAEGLTELGAEMRRMLDWLEHDRPRHWRTQVRKATDQVHEAQQALHRCLMFPIADERPSCYEERMDLKKAQARLAYCQEKEKRVRHWQRTVQHELFEYEGRISHLVRLVEVDMPHAMSVLTRIVRHLEEYQSLRASKPGTSYNDVSIAKDLWPDGAAAGANAEKLIHEAPAAAGGDGCRDASGDGELPAASGIDRGIEVEGQHDAKM